MQSAEEKLLLRGWRCVVGGLPRAADGIGAESVWKKDQLSKIPSEVIKPIYFPINLTYIILLK